MDLNKRDSRCNSRGGGGRQGLEMQNNYSEQFSDSSSNNAMQHTIKAVNSPCEEEIQQNVQTGENNSTVREGDIDTLGNSTGLSSPNSKKSLSKQVSLSKIKPNISEQDIKKEDGSLSPQNVSPLGGFVPSSGQSNCDDDKNGAPAINKTTNLSPLSCEKSTPFSRSGCSELEERPTSASLAISGNPSTNLDSGMLGTSISPKTGSDGFGSNVSSISNLSRNINPFNGNLAKYNCSTQGESTQPLNSSGGGGGGGEYMQQQNHVFVFSTQLANKSAEAVLGGQFPTIITYHCMQPSTKLFLEDFLKNPSKTSKLQRQYSLNIMNVMQSGGSSGAGPQSYWLNDCNNSGKFSHRSALRNVGVNKNNAAWGDQASVLDNQSCPTTSNSIDMLNNSEAFDNTKSAICGVKVEDKSSIPSLQGVKVPDENLTPQQRQHREEQLAKLKKMNEFLFPENEGNEFQSGHGNNSAPSEAAANNLGGSSAEMMHNSAGNCSDGPNKTYQPMRNISGNIGKQSGSGQGGSNLESIAGGLSSESILPADMMASGESSSMGAMQPIKHGCIPKMNTSNLNMIKPRGQCDMGNDQSSNTGHETSPDMSSSFNMKNCPSSSEAEVVGGTSNMNMPQEEWAKFQNNAFNQDGFKNRHSNVIHPPGMTGSPLVCPQNASLSRSLSIGVAGYSMQQTRPNTGPSSSNRNNSGPPPPYHQTQRSASVPIATQSPTHANSNNSNTDMPLPSPQGGSRVPFGVTSTPPNTDVTNSSTVITNPTHSSSASTSLTGLTSGNVMSSSIISNMTNPPPHSLSHISPREIDCIESAHKLKRSSPQKFKGPQINDMQDNTCMEAKYANFALNYPTCGMPSVNAQNMRQNMQQMPSQFCRRIDNIPLNPNCNRAGQNKTTSGFDPISSLAQMSQQLTGCGVGLSTLGAGGNSVTGGLMDVNSGELMGGPSGRSNDHSLDHCNQMLNTNNIGMAGLVGALGRPPGNQYNPDINNMLCGEAGTMDQRMLNGKMCVPNFNPNALNGVGGLRDSNIGCSDMMSSSRTMNHRRMPTNFDNFNMSPNVHVKVSAPNTIQYMPARSQNLNNMRVPPSIEFFQRYSNHQVIGNVGGHPAGQHHLPSDIANNPNMMNLFGNCNQMPTNVGQLSGGGGGGGFESLEVEGNVLPNDDYMNVR